MKKEVAEKIYSKKEYLTSGKRGKISISKCENKIYCIKERLEESTSPGTIRNEYKYNKELNKYGVGPKMYYYDEKNDFLIRDFVQGEKLEDFVEKNFVKNTLPIYLKILDQCRKMDFAKINKKELTNPHKDIIVTKQEPIIIDFERCRYTQKPQNVTQFIQYLTKTKTKNKYGLDDAQIGNIRILASNYKENPSRELFKKIKKEIKEVFTSS